MGPVVAVPKALKLDGLKLDQIDLNRTQRGFRLSGIGCYARNRKWPSNARTSTEAPVALGHPLGASGAKLTRAVTRREASSQKSLRPGDHVRRRPDRCGQPMSFENLQR